MPKNTSGYKTFQAASAVSAAKVVELTAAGKIQHVSTDGDKGIGVAEVDIAADGYGAVRLWGTQGTVEIQVTGTAVTPNTDYTTHAGGYVGATTGTDRVKALEAGVASDGITLEFLEL